MITLREIRHQWPAGLAVGGWFAVLLVTGRPGWWGILIGLGVAVAVAFVAAMEARVRAHTTDAERSELEKINDEIQDYVSTRGVDVPSDLIKKLSDLDFVVRTGSKVRRH